MRRWNGGPVDRWNASIKAVLGLVTLAVVSAATIPTPARAQDLGIQVGAMAGAGD